MKEVLTVGQRIRLLRILSGMTQAELGARTGMSQRNIAMIEKGRFRPRHNFHFQTTEMFHTSLIWTAGDSNLLFDNIGFFQLPPPSFASKEYSALKRKTNELIDVLRSIFPIFLEESKISKYSVAVKENDKVYFLYLTGGEAIDPILVLKAEGTYVSSVEDAINKAGLRKRGEVVINYQVFDSLLGKDQEKSKEALYYLLKELKVGGATGKTDRLALYAESRSEAITFFVEVKVLDSHGLTEDEAIHEIAVMEQAYNSMLGAKRIHIVGNPLRKF